MATSGRGPPAVTRRSAPVGLLAWVALGVVYVLWGSTYLANRLIIATVPPLLSRRRAVPDRRALLALVVLAVAGPCASG